jgi:CheY-specific phosphatase CheX
MDVAYVNPFIASVTHVFKEMVHVSCQVGKPFRKRDGHRFYPLYSHAATVEFSGPVSGMIALDFAQPVALSLASTFAGEEFGKVDANCADALAEIVNVVAGAAKKQMPCGQVSLSIARLQRTSNVTYPPDTPILAIPFDTDRGRMVMEVALRFPSGADAPAETS